eukprot:CAMPEP_0172843258 /NCGR_PEP_ID=MMETSP1075-20121228/31334_1 /TAXON_ID=2916 /ORGANISM="Ceratium fusus, Strain PA161109" /LENGTH=128 /DNA_ID=CAMNT_0013687503 /DNA_START=367 /DNA_END=753 /DNA_ORIENTATION=-
MLVESSNLKEPPPDTYVDISVEHALLRATQVSHKVALYHTGVDTRPQSYQLVTEDCLRGTAEDPNASFGMTSHHCKFWKPGRHKCKAIEARDVGVALRLIVNATVASLAAVGIALAAVFRMQSIVTAI